MDKFKYLTNQDDIFKAELIIWKATIINRFKKKKNLLLLIFLVLIGIAYWWSLLLIVIVIALYSFYYLLWFSIVFIDAKKFSKQHSLEPKFKSINKRGYYIYSVENFEVEYTKLWKNFDLVLFFEKENMLMLRETGKGFICCYARWTTNECFLLMKENAFAQIKKKMKVNKFYIAKELDL